ncbi:MAG: FxsA family protein [Thermoguttaceae bacterium]|jgi:UPF0716 protein FxsA
MAGTRTWLLAIVGLPAADLAAFAGMGWAIAWWVPLAIGFASGMLGLLVIGYGSWQYGEVIAVRLDHDEPLDSGLAAGSMLLLAGLLLVVPGLITKLLGLVLLTPGVRRLAVRALRRRALGDEGPATLRMGDYEQRQRAA